MSVSPETEISTAFTAGQAAALAFTARSQNPFVDGVSQTQTLQRGAWFFGYDAQLNSGLSQLLSSLGQFGFIGPVTKRLSNADVLSLNAKPVTMVPAIPNALIGAIQASIYRPSGGAYAAGAATRAEIQNNTSTVWAHSTNTQIWTFPSPFAVAMPVSAPNIGYAGISLPLTVRNAGGELGGSGDGAIVTVWPIVYSFPAP